MKILLWIKKNYKPMMLWSIGVLALLLVLLLTPTIFGYPRWVSQSLAKNLTPKNGSCEVGHIRGSLFSGFYIDNLTIQRPTKAGLLVAHAPEIEVELRILPLFSGKVHPKSLNISNANLRLDLYSEENQLMDSAIVEEINIQAKTTPNGRLTAHLTAEVLETKFNCYARLADFDKWMDDDFKKVGSQTEQIDGEGFVSHDTSPIVEEEIRPTIFDDKLMEEIHNVLGEIRNVTKGASSASTTATINGSLLDIDNITLEGSMEIADTVIYERSLLKAYGKFSATRKEALFPELHIVFNAVETLSGNAVANFDDHTIEGKFHAELMPENLCRLINAPVSLLLPRHFTFTSPIQFDGELPKAKWELAEIAPVMSFDCKDLLIEDLPIQHAAGQFTYNEKYVLLKDLVVEVKSTQENRLTGEMTLQLPDSILQGKLEGTANLAAILHDLKLVQADTPLNVLDKTKVTMILDPSPLQDWHLWNGSLAVQQDKATVADFQLQDFLAELLLKDRQLQLNAKAKLEGPQIGFFELTANAEMPETFAGNPFVMAFHTDIRTGTDSALNTTAKLIWENKDFRIEEGNASMRPEILSTLIGTPLKLDEDSFIRLFQCLDPQKPFTAQFEMPPINANGKWILKGIMQGEDIQFLNTNFSHDKAAFVLTEDEIEFQDIEMSLKDSPGKLTCDIKAVFEPFSLQITNADVLAKPTQISSLLFDKDVIDIYNKIWEDFNWTENSYSHLQSDVIEYRENDGNDWVFHMNGALEMKDFSYNDLPLRHLSTAIEISLPTGQYSFNDIRIADTETTEGDVLVGNASMKVENGVAGTFCLEKKGGRLRTMELILHTFTTLEEDLRPFELAPDANFTCNGRFHLDNFLTLAMEGTIDAPYVKHNSIVFDNVSGTWDASHDMISWDIPKAEFYGGSLTSTGFYNFRHNRGELLARAEGLPLTKLIQLRQNDSDFTLNDIKLEDIPGKLDAVAHLTFLKGWAGRPLHLEGSGEAHLTEADLWRVPTFHTLGIILSKGSFQFFSKDKIASLGKITQLDTHFECQGTSVRFNDVRTNGSIIALKGTGEYKLETGELDFLFSGELMKSFSLAAFALRPLAWAFDARLTGNLNAPVWNLQTPLSNVF